LVKASERLRFGSGHGEDKGFRQTMNLPIIPIRRFGPFGRDFKNRSGLVIVRHEGFEPLFLSELTMATATAHLIELAHG
jgi:hypothetical protein